MTGASTSTLLYRASRDGYHASAFHAKCDGRARTVTIIKIKNNYIFGGYTSAAWSSTAGFTIDSAAYLFRFRSNGVSTYNKYGVITYNQNPWYYYAIYSSSSLGPTFGGYYYYGYHYQHDIMTPTRPDVESGSCTKTSFGVASNVLAGATTWSTSEIEVFQI